MEQARLGPASTMWCWSASGRIRLTVSAATSARATGSSDRVSRPASMAAMSSTSLMRLSRCRAPDMMWPRLSRCSSPRSSRSSSWAKPRMAFRGVRSSWLIRDRYSLLASLACSAASLARRRSSSRAAWPVTSRETTSRPSGVARGRLCASRVTQCPSAWRTRTRTSALSSWPVSTRRWVARNCSRSSGWTNSELRALRPTRWSGGRPRIRSAAGLTDRIRPPASRIVMMSGDALMTAWRVASRSRMASSACLRSVTSMA